MAKNIAAESVHSGIQYGESSPGLAGIEQIPNATNIDFFLNTDTDQLSPSRSSMSHFMKYLVTKTSDVLPVIRVAAKDFKLQTTRDNFQWEPEVQPASPELPAAHNVDIGYLPERPQHLVIVGTAKTTTSGGGKQNASRIRRKNEYACWIVLCGLIPIEQIVTSKLFKEGICRLTLSFIHIRHIYPYGFLGALESDEGASTASCYSKGVGWQLFDALPGFILMLSPRRRIIYASETVNRVLGRQQHALIGKYIDDIIEYFDLDEISRALNLEPYEEPPTGLNEHDFKFDRKFVLRMKCSGGRRSKGIVYDGKYKYVHCYAQLIVRRHLCAGQLYLKTLGMIIHGQELPLFGLTKNGLRIETEMFMFRSGLNLEIHSLQGRIFEFTGYTARDLINTSFYDLVHTDDIDTVRECHKILSMKHQVVTPCYRLITASGGCIWVQTHAIVLPNLESPYITVLNYVLNQVHSDHRNIPSSQINVSSPKRVRTRAIVPRQHQRYFQLPIPSSQSQLMAGSNAHPIDTQRILFESPSTSWFQPNNECNGNGSLPGRQQSGFSNVIQQAVNGPVAWFHVSGDRTPSQGIQYFYDNASIQQSHGRFDNRTFGQNYTGRSQEHHEHVAILQPTQYYRGVNNTHENIDSHQVPASSPYSPLQQPNKYSADTNSQPLNHPECANYASVQNPVMHEQRALNNPFNQLPTVNLSSLTSRDFNDKRDGELCQPQNRCLPNPQVMPGIPLRSADGNARGQINYYTSQNMGHPFQSTVPPAEPAALFMHPSNQNNYNPPRIMNNLHIPSGPHHNAFQPVHPHGYASLHAEAASSLSLYETGVAPAQTGIGLDNPSNQETGHHFDSRYSQENMKKQDFAPVNQKNACQTGHNASTSDAKLQSETERNGALSIRPAVYESVVPCDARPRNRPSQNGQSTVDKDPNNVAISPQTHGNVTQFCPQGRNFHNCPGQAWIANDYNANGESRCSAVK